MPARLTPLLTTDLNLVKKCPKLVLAEIDPLASVQLVDPRLDLLSKVRLLAFHLTEDSQPGNNDVILRIIFAGGDLLLNELL